MKKNIKIEKNKKLCFLKNIQIKINNNNFIKNNFNLIISIFIIIGFLFIIKLFLFGIRLSSGGGFINFSILPSIHYHWTNAGLVSILLFLLFLFLLYKIKKEKIIFNKLKPAFLIFILGIFSNQIFLFFSPDFKFYLTPVTKQYKNIDGTINNLDKYLTLINKYCNYKLNFNYKLMSRYSICANNNKFHNKFDSIFDYVKVLESADRNNFSQLYFITIKDIIDNGLLKEAIKEYKNDTFYSYLILNYGENDEILTFLEDNLLNKQIKEILIFYKLGLENYNNNLKDLTNFEKQELYNTLKGKVINKFNNITNINKNLLF